MKKGLAWLLAVVMAFSMMGIMAYATDAASVDVSLTGTATATKSSTYTVTLHVSSAAFGGVQGTITYDSTDFTFANEVVLSTSMATANRVSSNEYTETIYDDGEGTLNFALLSDGSSTDLAKFSFTVSGSASGSYSFTLSGVKVSDSEGTELIADGSRTNLSVAVYEQKVDALGATIKTVGAEDIRFGASTSASLLSDASSVGFVIIPTRYLGNKELVLGGTYSGKSPVSATISKEALLSAMGEETEVTIKTVLTNSSQSASGTGTRCNIAYSARAYVVLTGGEVVYSSNVVALNSITGGVISRSCVDVAKRIASVYTESLDDGIKSIVSSEESWTLANYKSVVAALAEAASSLDDILK